jgi:hypothetical protein
MISVGDLVKKTDGTTFRNGHVFATVQDVDGTDIRLKETQTWCHCDSLEVVHSTRTERLEKELAALLEERSELKEEIKWLKKIIDRLLQ